MQTDNENTSTLIRKQPVLLKRFELLKTLGEGAAGAIYLVHDRERPGPQMALKVLVNDRAFDEHTRARFEEELRICQKIRHPNLVEAYELIDLDGALGFTMEYVPGSDLGSIYRSKNLTYSHIDDIFCQFLLALHELHKAGVVHRDIKLENIMLREDGAVKLSDLGLAKHGLGAGLTRSGILLGTAQYLPPEYIRSSIYDARSDLYAAGIVLLELLSKERRLAQMDGNEAIQHLIKTKFKIPLTLVTGVPLKYLAILERSMNPNPTKRFQNALEMREAFLENDPDIVAASLPPLHKIPDRNAAKPQPEPVSTPRNNRNLVILLAAATLLVLLGAVLSILPRH